MLGLALMIGEAFTPGFGVLGIGGLVAFVVGALFLFEGRRRRYRDSRSRCRLIVGSAITTAGLIFGVVGAAIAARERAARRPAPSR